MSIRRDIIDIYGPGSSLTLFGKVFITLAVPFVVICVLIELLAVKKEYR